MLYICISVMPLAGGQVGLQLTRNLGVSVPTRGADYAHRITDCSPGFENLIASLYISGQNMSALFCIMNTTVLLICTGQDIPFMTFVQVFNRNILWYAWKANTIVDSKYKLISTWLKACCSSSIYSCFIKPLSLLHSGLRFKWQPIKKLKKTKLIYYATFQCGLYNIIKQKKVWPTKS